MGVDMIILTGNPGIGVENQAIIHALTQLKEAVGDRVILTAGKMHASGIASEAGENILTPEDVDQFIEAGADVILLRLRTCSGPHFGVCTYPDPSGPCKRSSRHDYDRYFPGRGG